MTTSSSESQSLRSRFIGVVSNSTVVMFSSLAAKNVFRLAGNLVITRILAPEAFGVVGVITSISFLLTMLTDMGFRPFVVQARRADDPKFLDVIWTIRLGRSVLLAALMFFGAGLLAQAFDKPELQTPIAMTSFLFLIEGVQSLAFITAERARRISFVSLLELGIFVFQTCVAIVAAFLMKNFWAIIVSMYAGGALKILISYVLFEGSRRKFRFNREVSAELWRFSRFIIASGVIAIFMRQADKLFLARMIPLEILGLYMLAANMAASAHQMIVSYASRILMPLYAETHREKPETLKDVYYSARRRVTLFLAFIVGGGIGGGTLIFRILFDDRYLGAGLYFSLLCFLPLFRLSTLAAEKILVVYGRVRTTLEANVLRLAWIAVGAPLGYANFGVLGLIAAFALMELPALIYWWLRLYGRGVLNMREELSYLAAAAVGAAIGFVGQELIASLIASGVIPSF